MSHDVFVSYSSKDKAIADSIVAAMEQNGIRCWYAPRDIKPSDDWGKAITNGILASKVFLIIFSTNANRSQRVLDELNFAVTKEITIFPFRIENLEPDGAMELHLSSRHWLDAFDPSWESHIKKLIKNISAILDTSVDEQKITLPVNIARKAKEPKKKIGQVVAGVLIGALLLVTGWFSFKALSKSSQNGNSAVETPSEDGFIEETVGNEEYTYADMVLCYPALGFVHDWYKASSASIKQSAKEHGIKQLVISEDNLNQENQISAIQSCIQQGVNVIAFHSAVGYGWTDVLTEAQDAGIPVIIFQEDTVNIDESLYDVHLVIDNFLQGQKSAGEINKLLPNGGNIVEISGAAGFEQTLKRSSGFRDELNNNIAILDSQAGNWNKEEAFLVMEEFLKKYNGQIDGVFIQNDAMAMGAIEALEAAGIDPGEIKIVSIDGTRDAFQAMIDGWIQAEVETNPSFGSQIIEIAMDLMNGKEVEREVILNQNIYYPNEAEDLLRLRIW